MKSAANAHAPGGSAENEPITEEEWIRRAGKRLQLLRIENDVQQKDLAKFLNVSAGTVAHYEHGRRMVAGYTIYRLSKFFDVSTDYLLMKSDERRNNVVEKVVYREEYNDPDIRMIARSIKDQEEAEKLRQVAEAMFPQRFKR